MANEYYAIIGVEPNADSTAIRKGYFKALRQYTAEKDPVRHQELRQAYEVLSDEDRRREYDGLQVGGGEVSKWMEIGNDAYGKEEWGEAERAFKRALAISPSYIPARLQLARTLALAGDRIRAVELLEKVVSGTELLEVHSELGWIALAHVVKETNNEPDEMETQHKRLLLTAKEAFDRCIQLAPANRVGYLGRAKVEYYREDFATARAWARKAAAADGKSDFEDFPALSLIVETHVLQGDANQAAAVIREVRALTPNQPEVREYAVEQFVRFGMMMMRAKAFKDAVEVFAACQGFLPDEPRLKELVDSNLTAANGCAQYERAQNDSQLVPAIRRLALWAVALYSDEFDNEHHAQKFFEDVIDELGRNSLGLNIEQLGRLRDRYPAIWKCQDKVLTDILDQLIQHEREQRALASAPQARTEVATADGCGCLILFGIMSLGTFTTAVGALLMLT